MKDFDVIIVSKSGVPMLKVSQHMQVENRQKTGTGAKYTHIVE